MAALPTGIVAFLFTDVEGSTQLWEHQTDAMRRALARHDALLREIIDANDGVVFKTMGDEFCAAFSDPVDAVAAAVEAQRALLHEVPDLRVRMALHTGEPEFRDDDYFGPDLNRVARLLTAAHGGQVLLTRTMAELVENTLSGEAQLRSLGVHRLRDLTLAEAIFQLQLPDLPSNFPPPNTLDVAFRRGLRRAMAISAVVIAALTGLLVRAVNEQHRADANAVRVQRLLTLDETEHGVRRLEAGDALGLLDLIHARENAETIPDLREATATIWAGWHQSLAGRLLNMVGHDRYIWDVQFSPDGRWLATASDDRTVRLWDTRDWTLAHSLVHQAPVHTVLFSAAGKRLVTIAGEFAQLWDPATGTACSRPLPHNSLYLVAFRADGKLLATAGGGCVRLWYTSTGLPVGQPLLLDGSQPTVNKSDELVGFSPPPANSLVVATGQSVSLWNATALKREDVLARFEPPPVSAPARRQRLSPVLALGSDLCVKAIASDRSVWIWDAAEHRFRIFPIRPTADVERMATDLVSRVLATAGKGQRAVQLWNTQTGEPATPPLVHPDSIGQMAFGPRGTHLLVTLSGGKLYFWSTETGLPHQEMPPPAGSVASNRMALSPDGHILATAAPSGTVQLWGVTAPPPCERLPFTSSTTCISFVEGTSTLAAFSWDGLRLWSGNRERTSTSPAAVAGHANGAFSPDGQRLVKWIGTSLSLWQTITGRMLGKPVRLSRRVRYAVLSRHGAFLATISPSNTVQIWEGDRLTPRGAPLHHPDPVGRLEFSPNEALLATASRDRIWLWETQSGRMHVPPIKTNRPPRLLIFSPDSRLLAVATEQDSAVTLWSTETGQPYGHPMPHPMFVGGGSFSTNGVLLATFTDDNTVYVWNVRSAHRSRLSLAHREEVTQVKFSPDSRRLATASFGGARLWDVETGQLVTRTLLPGEPIEELQFAPGGDVLALRTLEHVHLWHVPPVAAGLPDMIRRTAITLGEEPVPGGGIEPLPWKKWRQLEEGK